MTQNSQLGGNPHRQDSLLGGKTTKNPPTELTGEEYFLWKNKPRFNMPWGVDTLGGLLP